jgi:hypothetical protein
MNDKQKREFKLGKALLQFGTVTLVAGLYMLTLPGKINLVILCLVFAVMELGMGYRLYKSSQIA